MIRFLRADARPAHFVRIVATHPPCCFFPSNKFKKVGHSVERPLKPSRCPHETLLCWSPRMCGTQQYVYPELRQKESIRCAQNHSWQCNCRIFLVCRGCPVLPILYIIEPKCAYAQWALIHRILSVCPSARLPKVTRK